MKKNIFYPTKLSNYSCSCYRSNFKLNRSLGISLGISLGEWVVVLEVIVLVLDVVKIGEIYSNRSRRNE